MPVAPDVQAVRRRYDGLARWYPVFEWLFRLPAGIRREAVAGLALAAGDSVLEVGCGRGRNLPLLVRAVGPQGRVFGVDLSAAMLAHGRALCRARGWRNVELSVADALRYEPPAAVAGVFFSLSCATMVHRREVLHHVWRYLRPGGRLVVMDAKTPPGRLGRTIRPFLKSISSATVLGDPDHEPWNAMRELAAEVEVDERWSGSYFICRATKPAS